MTAAPHPCMTGDERFINRYEMGQESRIAQLESQIALRDANIYNDQKSIEMYKYFDGQIAAINKSLGAQAVQNQATADSFQLVNERMDCLKKDMCAKITAEAQARQCADNTIVNYANNTFYAKQVADVTVSTTAQTPQATYNPLPAQTVVSCQSCC